MGRLIPGVLVLLMVACGPRTGSKEGGGMLLDNSGRFLTSTSAANLLTTAVARQTGADIVLFPADFLREDSAALLRFPPDEHGQKQVTAWLPGGARDEFLMGSMTGAAVKDFILSRTLEKGRLDLEVAGLHYHVILRGGIPDLVQITLADGSRPDPKRRYKVAVSGFLFGPPSTFPGYRYGHNLDRSFRLQGSFSLLDVVEAWLQAGGEPGSWHRPRAVVEQVAERGDVPELSPAAIQGRVHRSPWRGHLVRTRGVVTAVKELDDGGQGFFLQSLAPDDDPLTAEALYVEASVARDVRQGHLLRVTGVVHEEGGRKGLTRTALKEVEAVELLGQGFRLPEPVLLGPGDIPGVISTWRGHLGEKPMLNRADAIDFYETLENMRVEIKRPRVAGFAGGKHDARKTRSWFNLFLVPGGDGEGAGPVVIDEVKGDFHPEIIRITDHDYGRTVTGNLTHQVGDVMPGNLTGILTPALNNFRERATVFIPEEPLVSTSTMVPMAERAVTPLLGTGSDLTVAVWNVENLSARDERAVTLVGAAIRDNLACPDIVNLVEIQDGNGRMTDGPPDGSPTLDALIRAVPCPDADYAALNLDPSDHDEGGQPGGNIRVAMLWNRNRLQMDVREESGPRQETVVRSDGSLSRNPGRVAPADPAFRGTRVPLAAEFTFAGRRVIVIANHFNSKGGDAGLWSRVQPPVRHTDGRRVRIARRLNRFVTGIMQADPDALVVVAGDFNEFTERPAMLALEGDGILYNLLRDCPREERYTYSYQGNAQALDHILVSGPLYRNHAPDIDILHISTDYMGQIADHDPLVARFSFGPSVPARPCAHR